MSNPYTVRLADGLVTVVPNVTYAHIEREGDLILTNQNVNPALFARGTWLSAVPETSERAGDEPERTLRVVKGHDGELEAPPRQTDERVERLDDLARQRAAEVQPGETREERDARVREAALEGVRERTAEQDKTPEVGPKRRRTKKQIEEDQADGVDDAFKKVAAEHKDWDVDTIRAAIRQEGTPNGSEAHAESPEPVFSTDEAATPNWAAFSDEGEAAAPAAEQGWPTPDWTPDWAKS